MYNQLTMIIGKIKSVSKTKELEDGKKEISYTVEVERDYENSNGKKDKDIIECTYTTNDNLENIKKGNIIGMKGIISVEKKQANNLKLDSLILKVNEVNPISEKSKDSISISQSIIVGRLARDPEMRTTANGNQVANIIVAVDNRSNDKADFIRTAVWGKLAEVISKHHKGDVVFVKGKLKNVSKEVDDKQVLVTEYSSESISVLAKSKVNEVEKESNKDLGG